MRDDLKKTGTEGPPSSIDVEEDSALGGPKQGRAATSAPEDNSPPSEDTEAQDSTGAAAGKDGLAGSKLGRYLIVDRLGRGGMGVVYQAYDPQLDRRVALKVLRIKERSQPEEELARERLLREAQALAQLNHPNVVAVHDVGTVDVGPQRNAVYMTMEYIEGQTLKTWLRHEHPAQRKILETMISAGRGIAAAHAAGLIHRDIKPSNIIIGQDGRVRVIDFGLARSTSMQTQSSETPVGSDTHTSTSRDSPPTAPRTQSEESVSSGRKLVAPITLEGRVMGTPGYMAPEQYLGSDLNPKTDQFSFCVTLYEALYGRRPFTAKNYRALRYKVAVGRLDPPPPDSKVPAWLGRIVQKGLSVKESGRYPTMDGLLDDLSRDPRVFWQRLLVAIGIGALVLVSLLALILSQSQRQKLCQGFETRLAGVWDPTVQRAILTAFQATGRPYAQDTFERIKEALDRRAREWVEIERGACEATQIRGEQSGKLLDLRTHCLSRRLEELQALTKLFAGPIDGEVVDRAVQATLNLPTLARCSDTEALLTAFPPPEDPALREQVEAHRRRLDQAEALRWAGKYSEGIALASQVTSQARVIAYPPLQAEADLTLGNLQASIGDPKSAEVSLRRTVQEAAEAKDLVLRARALIGLVFVVGYLEARTAEAIEIGELVQSDIAFLGNDPALRADALNFLGIIHAKKGDVDHALALYQQALALRQKSQGPDHPSVANTLENIAEIFYERGDVARALQVTAQSIAITEKALGPEHPNVAISLCNRGLLILENGGLDEALATFNRAIDIWQKIFGPEHVQLAVMLNNIASVYQKKGDLARAQETITRALQIKRKAYGPDHPSLALSQNVQGTILLMAGKVDEAAETFTRAAASFEKAYGPDHPNLAKALTGSGECLLARHQARKALPLLERALAILGPRQLSPNELARTRFVLARALWDGGTGERDRVRALSLAREAQDTWSRASGAWVQERAELELWLEGHQIARPGRGPQQGIH